MYEIKDIIDKMKQEDSKYYTPEIEEFHVGFEYYLIDSNGNILEEPKYVFNKNLMLLMTKDTRVKYLDQEDIESLGWIDGETRGMSGFLFNPNTDDDFQMYLHDNLDKGYWHIQIFNWDSQYVFQGNIKNKSELIKLMKQLGIYETK